MKEKRLPTPYIILGGVLLAIGALSLLTWLGVPPFDNVSVFILSNVVGVFTLLVFGVIGGAFVGMILAHRILGNRDFSPFERATLESLAELRVALEELRATEKKLVARLEEAESRESRVKPR
ncbi:MAG: hypothetical protein ACYDCK_09620 [Thermoplasmatota archaeon]